MVGPTVGVRLRGGPPDVPTLGVEEEFLLLDCETLRPVHHGPFVSTQLRRCNIGEIQAELSPTQIESASSVCHDLEELRRDLTHLRTRMAEAALRHGCRLAAIGAPPTGGTGPPPVTENSRYQQMHERYGPLFEDQGVCACHVHIGTPDVDAALRASNHLRPWLPALLLVSTNSPFFRSADMGYASWRSVLWSRLPTACPPPHFTSSTHYQRLVDALLTSGMVLDPGMVYWFARPSSHAPTLEVRIADTAATVDEAVLLAGLVRALVTLALSRDEETPVVDDHLLQAACWRAALVGLEGTGLDPRTGAPVPSWELLDQLVEHVRPVLAESGDLELVTELLKNLRVRGSGANRQRTVFRRHPDINAVIDHVLAETVRSTAPGR